MIEKSGFNEIIGTEAPDELLGENNENTIGNDTLTGTSGDDLIDGRSGNDTIKGLAGNDVLIGGSGHDTIKGGSVAVGIDTGFQGVSTVINNRTYYLGQNFVSGVAQPEIKKYSGEVVYVDNRPSITRSSSQKEDLKIILQF